MPCIKPFRGCRVFPPNFLKSNQSEDRDAFLSAAMFCDNWILEKKTNGSTLRETVARERMMTKDLA